MIGGVNVERSYKFRIYPNKQQQELITKTFGCSRFVYNYYLDEKIKLYQESKQSMGFYACSKDLTSLKTEKKWLLSAEIAFSPISGLVKITFLTLSIISQK